MRSHSYIFTFNLVLAALSLAAFCTPLYLAETFLVPQLSSKDSQMQIVRYAMENGRGRPVLLLGDSTVRNLQERERDFDEDRLIVNLGAGGAMVMEWYFAMRNAFRVNPAFKVVVIGMANTDGLSTTLRAPPYYSYLLNLPDVWNEYRLGRLTPEQSLALAENILFKLPFAKDDLLYRLISDPLPSMRPLMMELMLDQTNRTGRKAGTDGAPGFEQAEWAIKAIVDFLREKGTELRIVLSPVSSQERSKPAYGNRRSRFYDLCRNYQLKCADFSERIPDDKFSSDGVHLRHNHIPLFRSLLDEYLKKDGLI